VTLVVEIDDFFQVKMATTIESCDELGAVEEKGLVLQLKCFVMSSVQLTHALKRKVQSQSQFFTPKRCPMTLPPPNFCMLSKGASFCAR
jgi:hypothetical protein